MIAAVLMPLVIGVASAYVSAVMTPIEVRRDLMSNLSEVAVKLLLDWMLTGAAVPRPMRQPVIAGEIACRRSAKAVRPLGGTRAALRSRLRRLNQPPK